MLSLWCRNSGLGILDFNRRKFEERYRTNWEWKFSWVSDVVCGRLVSTGRVAMVVIEIWMVWRKMVGNECDGWKKEEEEELKGKSLLQYHIEEI